MIVLSASLWGCGEDSENRTGLGGSSGAAGHGAGGRLDAGSDSASGTGGGIGIGGTAGTSGGAGSGGMSGSGSAGSGGASGSGGIVGVGGSAGTSGATGSGGAVGTGGASGSGGDIGTGGASGSGGAIGTGGASGSGGVVGTGGTSGAGGSGGASGSGGVGTCTAPQKPSHVTTVTNSPNYGPPQVFVTNGQVRIVNNLATKWLRWTGTAWSEEVMPWPSVLAGAKVDSAFGKAPVPAADGGELFMANLANTRYLTSFDGTKFSDPLAVPTLNELYGIARTKDGDYHLLASKTLYSGNAQTGWGPGTPVPLPPFGSTSDCVMAAASDGRIVIAYAALSGGFSSPRHLYVLSKTTGGAWEGPVDVTPQWAVSAEFPKIAAAPSGGVVVAVTGASTNYAVPGVWYTSDGKTFSNLDPQSVLQGPVEALSADCAAAPLVTLGSHIQHNLWSVSTSGVAHVDSKSWSYIAGSSARRLPNGKVYWGIGSTGALHEYRATQ
ncbi:MAG: hypothetical protein R3B13_20560 [Polyangiaceae bacterium]